MTLQQVVSFLAIAMMFTLVIVTTGQCRHDPSVVELGGTWSATQIEPRQMNDVHEYQMPGLFVYQGLAADGLVRIERNLVVPEGERWAIWLENPQWAVRGYWDGVLLDQIGDMDVAANGRDGAFFAELPVGDGRTHRVRLEVRGGAGGGGITGRTVAGPREVLRAMWLRAEGEHIGLALVLAVLGMLHFGVAARPARREEYLYVGLFSLSMAIWAFCRSEVSSLVLDDVEMAMRGRRATHALMGPFGTLFVSQFLFKRITPFPRGVLAIGTLAAILSLFVPFATLTLIEAGMDVVHLVDMVWFIAMASYSAYVQTRWARFLAIATAMPLIAATVVNMLVSYGLMSVGSVMFPAYSGVMLGCAVTLAIRHADEARRHERLLDGTADAILTVNRHGVVEDTNPAARAMFGDLDGKAISEWVRAEDRATAHAHLRRGLRGVDRAEMRFVSGERGERVMDSLAAPLDNATALVVFRDVTLRRKIDEGMIRAARVEMMGNLVGGIAHDFNNMLGTLLAQIGFLQMAGLPRSEADILQRMERVVDRSTLLIRRLLTAVGGTASEVESVDVGALVRNAVDLVQPAVRRGVTIDIVAPEQPIYALAAVGDLEQVVVNLLVNARDALSARNEGRIWVHVSHWRLGEATGPVIVVEDDGPGVPVAIRGEIFEPFVTTKAPGKGTGLGLAVAERVMRDCEGRVWMEDRPGGGARFLLALRACHAAPAEAFTMPQGRSVLLVEDEAPLLETFRHALTEGGFTVTAVSGGGEALAWLREHAPDVLVTDVVMPDVSGIDVADTCSRLYPTVPVLLVSGFLPDQALASAQQAAWYRLDKPVRTSRLVATVARIRRLSEQRARGDEDTLDLRSQPLPSLAPLTAAHIAWAPEPPPTSGTAPPTR